MAETLTLAATDKAGRYEEILPQIASVTADETDRTANLANTAAILKEAFDFFWVGFYEVKSTDGGEAQLVLGPFQGPLACTRIRRGRGVCGTAWAERRTLVVPDVDLFPGHIACSSLSRSEIVVPIFAPDSDEVVAVIDIDSREPATFDDTDRRHLERLAALLGARW